MAGIILEPELIEIPAPDISHLVTEDDEPVDTIFSEKQQRLLTTTLYTSWKPAAPMPFVALANVGLFYTVKEPAVVPDVMVSVDVAFSEELWEKRHRSYFMWEYGKPPEVVIEVVSNRKGHELTRKKRLYARLGIAYYVVFDPNRQLGNSVLQLFERRGSDYVLGRKLWLPVLGLGLTLWEGEYEAMTQLWLRWCDHEGNLLLTGAEAAAVERQKAEQERQRAEKLLAQLRALGIEPEL